MGRLEGERLKGWREGEEETREQRPRKKKDRDRGHEGRKLYSRTNTDEVNENVT